jgi:phosphate starvation-inducible PhoH-like protein
MPVEEGVESRGHDHRPAPVGFGRLRGWSACLVEFTIQVPRGADRVSMLGSADRNLKMIREALGVNISTRDDSVMVSGRRDAVSAARRVFDRLNEASVAHEHLSRRQVLDLISDSVAEHEVNDLVAEVDSPMNANLGEMEDVSFERLAVYAGGRRVEPRTENQRYYLEAIRDNDLVFGIGPAGTGKTYLAVAAAVHLLKNGRIRKLILVRPAVEAGEKLGFLPGALEEKVNPYLRPLFDALHDMMDFATLKRFMMSDVVEVAPLAFMRGRTLNDAVIILDEAQNTTKAQMQMFLTRMGARSKMIVTGDTTQIDIPEPTQSGLIDAARRLRRVPGVGFVTLEKQDIVRHDLVQRIVEAYGDGGPAPGAENGRP